MLAVRASCHHCYGPRSNCSARLHPLWEGQTGPTALNVIVAAIDEPACRGAKVEPTRMARRVASWRPPQSERGTTPYNAALRSRRTAPELDRPLPPYNSTALLHLAFGSAESDNCIPQAALVVGVTSGITP